VSAIDCTREQDVVDAVQTGRWPDLCDRDLRAHLASCPVCRDVAAVAAALHEEHESGWREARVPPAGRVWWRAEMRARQEAAKKAAQPIAVAHALAAACTAGLVLTVVQLAWSRLVQSGGFADGFETALDTSWLEPASMARWGLPVAVALGASLLVTSLAVYLALKEH
jgi:predicted anti-sigma-YlaC factor YlaD